MRRAALLASAALSLLACTSEPPTFGFFDGLDAQMPANDAANDAASEADTADTSDGEASPPEADGASDSGSDASEDAGATEPTLPVFLLAGQSNMEGNVDAALLEELLAELATGPADTLEERIAEALTTWYQTYDDGYALYGYSPEMVARQAAELARLRSIGVLSDSITAPLEEVLCGRNDDAVAPLQATCGNPIGPEWVLGHVLAGTEYAPTSLIKVVRGGTSLLVDWLSPTSAEALEAPVGEQYEALQRRIASLADAPETVHPMCVSETCSWGALLWFQGENDCFDAPNAEAYEANLTRFLADVRAEVGDPDLPVVIVEVGAWAQSLEFGGQVTAAQRAVAAADANAILVPTSDLSGFYHYDPAAQMIMGERIARALLAALND